jgi:hypothetical protein
VRLLADRVRLTGGLSGAPTRCSFRPVHDRGRVLVDLAVLLADGGEASSDAELAFPEDIRGSIVSSIRSRRMLQVLQVARLVCRHALHGALPEPPDIVWSSRRAMSVRRLGHVRGVPPNSLCGGKEARV